jgi:predicted nucleotidyltransferase
MIGSKISLTEDQIRDFCLRWKIKEFALFGSVLREDFNPQSDVDVLVDFSPAAEWSLIDHMKMENELEKLLGREVEILSKKAMARSENWIRREDILNSAKVIYAS